ncbi:MAG TPA: methyltransferase domain-containing protein [Thermodesulfobacteriota bacterium]|nr:methyltransferase domain-containing protein [Thermodesulfobacteriota bacterium]
MNLVAVGDGLSVIDLGCGTGELTRMLADSLPRSDVLGIDSSPDMLERAKTKERKGLRFELGSIEDVSGEWDLIFSNAALQWVDRHDVLIPALFKLLKPGGQIAVQVPSNHNHKTQLIVHEIAEESPFAGVIGGWSRKSPVLQIEAYAGILYECGGTGIDVFEKVFPHVLEDSDAIADWLAGTMMRPYLARLPHELQRRFMDAYRERLRVMYPGEPVFYPFRRIFFTAFKTKSDE